MNKLIGNLFLLLFSVTLSGQVYFAETGDHIGWFDPATCEVDFFRNGTEFFPPEFESSQYTDIALTPDGRLFGLIIDKDDQVLLVEIDFSEKRNADTLATITNDNYGTSLVCSPSGIFYIGGQFLHSYDPQTNQLDSLGFLPGFGIYQGDLVFYQGDLLGSVQHGHGDDRVHSLWRINREDAYQSTKIYEFSDGYGFRGMTTYWNSSTESIELIGSGSTPIVGTEGKTSIISRIDIDSQTQTQLCELILPIDYFAVAHREVIFGLTSPDEFRQEFKLRLDLDSDNSRGRLIDHFIIDTLCAVEFPIADHDISIYNDLGRIDSLTIQIAAGIQQAGKEVLFAPDAPLFSINGQGTSHLTIVNQGGAEEEDFIKLLRQVRFGVLDQAWSSGERRIDCYLHSGGRQSDAAMAYIPVQVEQRANAGEDAVVELCFGKSRFLFSDLGPDARPGGRWEPPLIGGTDFFNGYQDTAGLYRYIVEEGSCGADTATVQVSYISEMPPIGFIPDQIYSEVSICPGDTLVWSLPLDAIYEYQWRDIDNPEPTLYITEPGLYQVSVIDTNLCNVGSGLLVTPGDTLSYTQETRYVCTGNSFEWEGQVFIRDTMVCETYLRPALCDSTHCIDVQFVDIPEVHRSRSICEGQVYDFYGQQLDNPGNYTAIQPIEAGCDTLVHLALTMRPNSEVVIDTTISEGDTIYVGNSQYLTESGLYYITLRNAVGCDSLITLNLDVVSSTHIPLGEDYYLPSLLRRGQGFTLYNRSGLTEEIRLLEVFDLHARPVFRQKGLHTNDATKVWRGRDGQGRSLPPGMYVYRILMRDGRKVTGKVVLIE